MKSKLLTIEDAARVLDKSPITVRALFRTGRLTGKRRRQGPWSRIYVDPASVEQYKQKQPKVPYGVTPVPGLPSDLASNVDEYLYGEITESEQRALDGDR